MTFTPVQKLSITTGAAMTLLAAVGLVSYLSTTQMVDAQEAAAHTNAIIASLDQVAVQTMSAENAARGFVATGNANRLATVASAQSDVEYALDSLRTATEDHPDQRRHLDSLGMIIGAQFRDVRELVAVRQKSGRDAAVALMNGAHAKTPSPTRLLAEMRDEEVRVLGEKSRVMVESGKTSRMFVVAGSIFALLLAFIALQPLRSSVERRLTERLSRTVTAIPDDEEPQK